MEQQEDIIVLLTGLIANADLACLLWFLLEDTDNRRLTNKELLCVIIGFILFLIPYANVFPVIFYTVYRLGRRNNK